MATEQQDQGISKENLDQITTGTFAQDVQAYRSILLKYEKEVNGSGFDSKRAAFILKEVTGMQEVVFDRMQQAGRDARKLGVPPEEIEQTMQIYKRTLAGAMLQYTLNYEYVFGREANAFLALIEADQSGTAEDPGRKFAQDIKSARMLMNQILSAPNTAFMMFPLLATRLPLIEAAWKSRGWSTSNSGSSSPPPPAPPSNSGGDSGSDLPRRVERLETKVDKMTDSIGDIKTILTRMEGRLDHMPTKADLAATGTSLGLQLARIEERITHMPTKVQMYAAGGTAVAALLGILAKAMKWI